MSPIRNHYTYLITNNAARVDRGWHDDYTEFTGEVAQIRKALWSTNLQDPATYTDTSFALEGDPWRAFAKRLLYEKANGISSRGQSVLSDENFKLFIEEPRFIEALQRLIKTPDRESFSNYWEAWEATRRKCGANGNPLLINRTLAACTTRVSSTVNQQNFDTVYRWLVKEGVIEIHPAPSAGWYDRNVQVMDFLRQEFAEDLAKGETSEPLLSMFVWYLFENISNPFSLKKQVIRYGAPGTGKTYAAKRDTQLLFAIWREKYPNIAPYLTHKNCIEVVQFHPSYGYEDFIEGLRPILVGTQAQLTLQNGIFKEFCRKAGTWEIEVHHVQKAEPNFDQDWAHLTAGQLKPYLGSLLKGPAWQGFEELEDSERIADVVPPFFFIIDEINRAELSRVLGEIMIAIEYRGAKEAISTQYARLNTDQTGMLNSDGEYKFFIPHNVYLIGTMNTIDRSVESFDLALRRRFRWERTDPDLDSLRLHLEQRDQESGNRSNPWAGLADNLAQLNTRIKEEELLGADYQIGHAYLMNLRYPSTLPQRDVRKKIWEDSLRPLIEEYLRGSGRADTLIPELAQAFGIR